MRDPQPAIGREWRHQASHQSAVHSNGLRVDFPTDYIASTRSKRWRLHSSESACQKKKVTCAWLFAFLLLVLLLLLKGRDRRGRGGGGSVLISIVSQVGSVDTNQWRDNSTPSIAWRRESYKEEALHNLS